MVKIGLEIHGYLQTHQKLFCECLAIHGAKKTKPNEHICPTCTGQPGSKPMLPNSAAIDKAILIALILNCKINGELYWQRKHYNWPDLPKGYQNTLSGPHAKPIGENGNFEGIRITEAHLEEDPAAWNPETGEIDYNRSGLPLIEIVTEPDFTSKEQVEEWLRSLKETLSYAKALNKNLGLKADVNISISGGERVEIKNVNSINNIVKAIEVELKRQEKDKPTIQQTRRFDDKKETTTLMRTKEQAQDYRFITDPDLPPIVITKERIARLVKQIPETPKQKLEKLIKKYKIDKEAAKILTKNIDLVEFFEKIITKTHTKLAVRWVTEELLSVLHYNKKELEHLEIKPEHFIELLKRIENKSITELKAKEILRDWKEGSYNPKTKEHKIISTTTEIEKLAKQVIKENKKAVEDYKNGETKVMNFLVGQVMKLSNKRADFKTAKEVLEKRLK